MAEAPQEPAADVPEPTTEASRPGKPRSRVRRYSLPLLALITAVVSALVVTIFSVDLGPELRKYAEQGGSKWLDRPMHIGKVRALLTPGEFEFSDVVIEGLKPTDRPFLVAKSIKVSLPWWTAISRHMDVDSVEMTDWTMVIESFPEGKHNFPRVKGPPRPPRTTPKTFFTTLRQVVASRGRFT